MILNYANVARMNTENENINKGLSSHLSPSSITEVARKNHI